MKHNSFLILIMTLTATLPGTAQYVMDKTRVPGKNIQPALHHSESKKLIHTSNTLQWAFVKDNIAAMESRHPYLNGVAASMNGDFSRDYLMLSGDKRWTDEDIQLTTVSEIRWGQFTDNFVILYFGDKHDLGFFNDDKWSVINYNAGMISRMVKAGRFKGVFLDDENYFEPSHGWAYKPEWYPGYTAEQVRAKCRERGRDFMRALQKEMAGPMVVFDFIWFGDHWNDYDTTAGRQLLWLAFKDGMLEAARTGDLFVEGNEMAYYYQETTMFTDMYNEFRVHRFRKYGAPDLQKKYCTQVEIGHGIYPTLYYGGFRWPHVYSDKEHDLWWKHQLYHALLTSDRYVWIWSEQWNWFGDGTNKELTPNFAAIISEVKTLLQDQQGLPYDMVKKGDKWEGNLVTPSEKWHIAYEPAIQVISPVNRTETGPDLTIGVKTTSQTKRVEFFVNSLFVGEDLSFPFSLQVNGLAEGTYTLFARSFSTNGEHLTSAPVLVSVVEK
jgi:hypothetical protein